MKKVLVISTSLRKNGNSETLAKYFADGAVSAGNETELISLAGKTINFCRGCLACQKLQKCVISDDSDEIVEKMKNADVICFASPIYYYEMSGQMKVLLDRTNPLYPSDYKFRDIYFLSSAAENESGVDEKAVNGLQGWIDCFEKAQLKGTVFAGGVNNIGDIKKHTALKSAFELGKNV